MTRFEPYHLICDWQAGGELSLRLLGCLLIELTPGQEETVQNYSLPVVLDVTDPADQAGLTWLRGKIRAATQAKMGTDPVERPKAEPIIPDSELLP